MAEAIRLRIVLEDGVTPNLATIQAGLLAMQRTAGKAFGRGTRLQVQELDGKVKDVGTSAKNTSRSFSTLSGAAATAFGSRSASRIGAFSRLLGKGGVAGAAGIAGAAVVAFGVATARVFTKNDRLVREANALFQGFNTTTREELRGTSRALSVEYQTSIGDVAQAFAVAGGAGLEFAGSQRFVGEVIRFAAANFAEVGPAAQLAIQAINAFRLEMSDLRDVTNDLTIAYDEGVFKSFNEFSGTLDKVGVPAQQLGLRLQEVSAAMSIMTQAGFSGARASTSLARLLTELDREGGRVSLRFKEIAGQSFRRFVAKDQTHPCLLYTSDAADE